MIRRVKELIKEVLKLPKLNSVIPRHYELSGLQLERAEIRLRARIIIETQR